MIGRKLVDRLWRSAVASQGHGARRSVGMTKHIWHPSDQSQPVVRVQHVSDARPGYQHIVTVDISHVIASFDTEDEAARYAAEIDPQGVAYDIRYEDGQGEGSGENYEPWQGV